MMYVVAIAVLMGVVVHVSQLITCVTYWVTTTGYIGQINNQLHSN